jgi:hypothetical protein
MYKFIYLLVFLSTISCETINFRELQNKNNNNLNITIQDIISQQSLSKNSIERHFVLKNAHWLDSEFIEKKGQILSLKTKKRSIYIKVDNLFLDDSSAFDSLKNGEANIIAIRYTPDIDEGNLNGE